MLLNVKHAEYQEGYKLRLTFNTEEKLVVDLEETIKNDTRKIFQPLKNQVYFRQFKIHLNTIVWENEADFAPEFLLELGMAQKFKKRYARKISNPGATLSNFME